MKKLGTLLAAFVIAFAVMAVVAILNAVPVYFLWNAVVPDIFKLPDLSFAQAVALTLLINILFKSGGTIEAKE